MRVVKKALGDVKPGDRLIDAEARVTTVLDTTDETSPVSLFELDVMNDDGERFKLRAEGSHVWPLDPEAYGSLPPDAEGETEATTSDIAKWVAGGWQPRLSPAMVDGSIMHWVVRRALLMPDDVRDSTKVKCVKVDSPTHTFMLADDDNSESQLTTLEDLASNGIDDAPGVIQVSPETFDLIARHGVPTHNCGGPLTLDTMLKTPEGCVSMGDVETGDMVLNPVGEPVEVLWKSPLMIPDDIIELDIEPADDTVIPDWTIDDFIHADEDFTK